MSVSRHQYDAALSRVELYSLAKDHPSTTPGSTFEADQLEDYGEAEYAEDLRIVAAFENGLPGWQRRALIESKGRRALQRRRERGLSA